MNNKMSEEEEEEESEGEGEEEEEEVESQDVFFMLFFMRKLRSVDTNSSMFRKGSFWKKTSLGR